jgi:hypothetical protein
MTFGFGKCEQDLKKNPLELHKSVGIAIRELPKNPRRSTM